MPCVIKLSPRAIAVHHDGVGGSGTSFWSVEWLQAVANFWREYATYQMSHRTFVSLVLARP